MMTRHQFLRSLAGAGVGVLGLSTLAGCTDDGSSAPTVDAPKSTDAPKPPVDAPPVTVDAPAAVCSATNAAIGTNHGHALAVPAADIAAGIEKSYDIKGGSMHPHTVVITAAMFAMLKAGTIGTAIMATSSTDANHAHSVTITCA